MIEPVDPFERGELDGLEIPPRPMHKLITSRLHARPGVTLDFDSTRRDLATWAAPEYGLLLRTSARW